MIPPQRLLQAYGHRPTRALGQHFLTDGLLLARIAAATGSGEGDTLLEIGPGPGVLTCQLLATGARVVAVEKDRRAAAFLREKMPKMLPASAAERLHIIEGDALKIDLEAALSEHAQGPWAAVGNLPYNVGTAILMRLIEGRFGRCVLMFQREVAQRLVADPGSKKYGSLSLAVQARVRAHIIEEVPPSSFAPPPKVHSSVVDLQRVNPPAVPPEELATFETVTRAAFSARRKTVRNSLKRALSKVPQDQLDRALDEADIPHTRRPEKIALANYLALARQLAGLL